jgi:hypothetical protein
MLSDCVSVNTYVANDLIDNRHTAFVNLDSLKKILKCFDFCHFQYPTDTKEDIIINIDLSDEANLIPNKDFGVCNKNKTYRWKGERSNLL